MNETKKKSEIKLRELREQLMLPFFRTKEQLLWDGSPKKIIIIGSGIGGMASGALFAKVGHRVSVLELNKELIGGHGRCLTRHGMKYSMGPQYVWEFGDGMIGDRFLRFLNIKESNPFIAMDPDGFERLFIGKKNTSGNYFCVDFKVPQGLENFRKELTALFPDEDRQTQSPV